MLLLRTQGIHLVRQERMTAGGVLLGGGAVLFFTASPSTAVPDRVGAKGERWSARAPPFSSHGAAHAVLLGPNGVGKTMILRNLAH